MLPRQFALHRTPSGHPRRRLCSSLEDIAGRVRIGVGRVPAVRALENRLALATPLVDGSAHSAGLRRVRRLDPAQFAIAPGQFVGKLSRNPPPARVEDRSVQSGLLTHVVPWSGGCASGAGRHASDVEILDDDHAKRPDEAGGAFMAPVPTESCGVRLGSRQRAAGSTPTVGTMSFSRQRARLFASTPVQQIQALSSRNWRVDHFPGGKRSDVNNTSINADGREEVLLRCVFDFAAEDNMPSESIMLHCDVSDSPDDAARQSELDLADFRNVYNTPFGVEFAPTRTDEWEPKGVVPTSLARCRVSGAASMKIFEGPLQITQCILLTVNGRCGNPIELPAKRSELPILRCGVDAVAGVFLKLPPPIASLFKGAVVNSPAHPSKLPELLFLFGGGVKPKPVAKCQHRL